MADTKLSALTALAATPAVDDEVYIRDVSEAAATESKRITIANLMAASASLTVAETEVYNAAAPVAWTDLDLSGTIGSQASLVLLKLTCAANQDTYYAVRKNGDADEFYRAQTQPMGVAIGFVYTGSYVHHITLLVATDTNGVIEWKAGGNDTVVIDIIGYIK